jgi:hypothetical protein
MGQVVCGWPFSDPWGRDAVPGPKCSQNEHMGQGDGLTKVLILLGLGHAGTGVLQGQNGQSLICFRPHWAPTQAPFRLCCCVATLLETLLPECI